jgi:hypothetical protein
MQLHTVFTSALDGVEWIASCPSSFLPRIKSPQYALDRKLGGPQSWSGGLATNIHSHFIGMQIAKWN